MNFPTRNLQEFGRTDASGDDGGVLGRQLLSGSCWVGVGDVPPQNLPRRHLHLCMYIWVFPKIGVPQNGWFIMEIPIKMDDLGLPLFSETSIYIYTLSSYLYIIYIDIYINICC